MSYEVAQRTKVPWNRGKPVGQKLPLTQQQVRSIRMGLDGADKRRDLALLNLAFDRKLWACDLLKLNVSDVPNGPTVVSRAMIVQQKTGRPADLS